MAKKEDRKFLRIPIQKTLKLKSSRPDGQQGLLTTLASVNVSESGIQFESTYRCDPNRQYIIIFTGKDDNVHEIRIKIIWVQEIITGTQFRVGAMFDQSDSAKIKLLLQ